MVGDVGDSVGSRMTGGRIFVSGRCPKPGEGAKMITPSKKEIDDEDIRNMLGLADKSKIINLLKEVFEGETTKAIGYAFRSRDSNSTWKYSGYQGTSSSSDSGVLHHTAGHTEFTDQATEDEEYYIEIIKNGARIADLGGEEHAWERIIA